ncbi:MAG TPA: hypothetical protein VJO99_17585 [Burkholderiaceae bacterium]|nr:hypothetical protein [Burkholderiaceae bacterium]
MLSIGSVGNRSTAVASDTSIVRVVPTLISSVGRDACGAAMGAVVVTEGTSAATWGVDRGEAVETLPVAEVAAPGAVTSPVFGVACGS